MPERTKPKYFYSYATVMSELKISRRTLQRWIDDMNVEPLEFEDQLKVFLRLPDVERLREYSLVMRTRDAELIASYRRAVEIDDTAALSKLRRKLGD